MMGKAMSRFVGRYAKSSALAFDYAVVRVGSDE